MDMIETNDAGASVAGPPMTPTRLREWVKIAQPGARMIYGYGGVVAHACSAPVRETVMALYELGYLTPHRSKDGDRVVQLVLRSTKPYLKGASLAEPRDKEFRTSPRAKADRLFGGERS